MTTEAPGLCRCSCGEVEFPAPADPLFRMICHCSICQSFNEAPYADVVVFRAKSMQSPPAGKVAFDTYRPPPNVQRGRCVSCEKPALEVLATPLLPNLVMIPRSVFTDPVTLPDPAAHLFYESRVADAADEVPKYTGYWRSQLAFGQCLFAALFQT